MLPDVAMPGLDAGADDHLVQPFSLRELFDSQRGAPVGREKFLDVVRGCDAYPNTCIADNFIASLRCKIEAGPQNPHHLLTVRGVGYRLAKEPGASFRTPIGREKAKKNVWRQPSPERRGWCLQTETMNRKEKTKK